MKMANHVGWNMSRKYRECTRFLSYVFFWT